MKYSSIFLSIFYLQRFCLKKFLLHFSDEKTKDQKVFFPSHAFRLTSEITCHKMFYSNIFSCILCDSPFFSYHSSSILPRFSSKKVEAEVFFSISLSFTFSPSHPGLRTFHVFSTFNWGWGMITFTMAAQHPIFVLFSGKWF